MATDTQGKALLLASSILALGFLIRPSRTSAYAINRLINPASVADIASDLPANTEDFILSAWGFVGREISYSPFGSFIHIYNSTVECENCMLAQEVLVADSSNCVGKSILLTSILRNRIPPDQVYMVVGEYHRDGVGGHAWVIVEQNSVWYLLESTSPPPAYPWMSAVALESVYVPDAYINDKSVVCYDPDMCTVNIDFWVSDCPCRHELTF